MTEPKFGPVDLTEMMESGVLLAANETFFWPLGLALTWQYDSETGIASGLHISEWKYDDGHAEGIVLEVGDPVAVNRRFRFQEWAIERIGLMKPEAEQHRASRALGAYAAMIDATAKETP
jgi:hypothetical protein